MDGAGELMRVVAACTIAMLVFTAITMGWFRDKCRWWEIILLTMAVTLLFRPGFFMDRIMPEYRDVSAAQVFEVAKAAEPNDQMVMLIKGTTIEGEEITKTVALRLGAAGAEGRKRLADAGLQLVPLGDQVQIGALKFGSRAHKGGFEQGWDVAMLKVKADRPSKHWFYLPGLLLIALVWWLQGRRMRRDGRLSMRSAASTNLSG